LPALERWKGEVSVVESNGDLAANETAIAECAFQAVGSANLG
jgi:hypothetical protein